MTDLLRQLTKTAAGIIVFGSVCEMILPDNAYKKYIHLSIGLMLVMAFVAPFTGGVDTDGFEIPPLSAYVQAQTMEEETLSRVKEVYTDKINDKIKNDIINEIYGDGEADCDTLCDVLCDISFEEEDFGTLCGVDIRVKETDNVTFDSAKDKIKDILKKNYGLKEMAVITKK